MRLDNVRLADTRQPVSIGIHDGIISYVDEAGCDDDLSIHFNNALVFPGLINSHDHLDFNCFSPLGERKYNNYTEWGRHIHEHYKKEIDAVTAIPRQLRERWGMYKNLLAGVTTVVNHGRPPTISEPLISICRQQDLHSVGFEKRWKWKLNNPMRLRQRCVIHAGEGVDGLAHAEINELLRFNLLKRKLIAVHGVAMSPQQARAFDGLVWCPASNELLLGRHANVRNLKTNTAIVFGTDSTLTGSWDIWQHLRMAKALEQVDDKELCSMVTSAPAKLWKLNSGAIRAGAGADLVVARSNQSSSWNSFFQTRPQDLLVVMQKGAIRLFDEQVLSQLSDLHVAIHKFCRIRLNGAVKFVEGDLFSLVKEINRYCPSFHFPFQLYP